MYFSCPERILILKLPSNIIYFSAIGSKSSGKSWNSGRHIFYKYIGAPQVPDILFLILRKSLHFSETFHYSTSAEYKGNPSKIVSSNKDPRALGLK